MDTQTKEKKTTITLSLNEISRIWGAIEVDMGTLQSMIDKDDPNCEWKERLDDLQKLDKRIEKAYNRCKNKK